MDLAALHEKLVAAARSCPVAEKVPYAFEKRVVACLLSRSPADKWEDLARGLWRAAASCVGVALLLCAWSFFRPAETSPTNDFALDFEQTVMAAAHQEQAPDPIW